MSVQTKQVDFGKRSGLRVCPVSMGAMRFPAEELAIPLIRQAIDAGMIYIDTSRGYGNSETILAKALKDGYREKVILSTKWCPWNIKVQPDDDTSAQCAYKRLLESMERLDVDYLDFYQIWSINNFEQYQQATCKGGMLDGIRRAKDEGLIGHIGFTTHDTPDNIRRYIDQADWCEAILFSHNVLNPTYKEIIARTHEKGIATLVMNPLAGGFLAEESPVLQRVVSDALGIDDVVQAAHRYLAGDDNIDTILCGINKPSDITSTIDNYSKPPLTAQQRKDLEEAMAEISSKGLGFCSGCKYCMPCPEGIDIPAMMNIVYLERLLHMSDRAGATYRRLVKADNSPARCTQCGQCEQKCTQHLKIIEELAYLLKKFS
ncbi:MAG: hypothetical protein GWP14_05820 [Actinobacteria bacterium]|nr:hypothetical protein [Actinomycetota bacterium]